VFGVVVLVWCGGIVGVFVFCDVMSVVLGMVGWCILCVVVVFCLGCCVVVIGLLGWFCVFGVLFVILLW